MATDPDRQPDQPAGPHQRAGPDPVGPDRSGTPTVVGVSAVALLGVACCAGPALLTAGAMGVLGSWLASPWLLAAAALLLAAALGWGLRRRTRHPGETRDRDRGQADCCAPRSRPDVGVEQPPIPPAAHDVDSAQTPTGSVENP